MRSVLVVVPCLALLTAAPLSAAELKIRAAGSKIEFVGTKKTGSHKGGFKQFSGTLSMPAGDVTAATVKVEIATESLFSDDAKLTQHLKAPDFFDVRKHPKATFTSTSIKASGGAHTITGNLTLHGVTRPVSIPATITSDNGSVTIAGTFKIAREDFGMVYGKGMIDNDVRVTIQIKASK